MTSLSRSELALLTRSCSMTEFKKLLDQEIDRRELSLNPNLDLTTVEADLRSPFPKWKHIYLVHRLVERFGFLAFHDLCNSFPNIPLLGFDADRINPYSRVTNLQEVIQIKTLLEQPRVTEDIDPCLYYLRGCLFNTEPNWTELSTNLSFQEQILKHPKLPWVQEGLFQNSTFVPDVVKQPLTTWGFSDRYAGWDWDSASRYLPTQFILGNPELPWEAEYLLYRNRPGSFSWSLLEFYVRLVTGKSSKQEDFRCEVRKLLVSSNSRHLLREAIVGSFSVQEVRQLGFTPRYQDFYRVRNLFANPIFVEIFLVGLCDHERYNLSFAKCTVTIVDLYRHWDSLFKQRWYGETPSNVQGLEIEDITHLTGRRTPVPGFVSSKVASIWWDLVVCCHK